MSEKTKGQLPGDLKKAQKLLEESTEVQDHMIRKFQTLIANEGLFSQILDFFPYPIIIFTPENILKPLPPKQKSILPTWKKERYAFFSTGSAICS